MPTSINREQITCSQLTPLLEGQGNTFQFTMTMTLCFYSITYPIFLAQIHSPEPKNEASCNPLSHKSRTALILFPLKSADDVLRPSFSDVTLLMPIAPLYLSIFPKNKIELYLPRNLSKSCELSNVAELYAGAEFVGTALSSD